MWKRTCSVFLWMSVLFDLCIFILPFNLNLRLARVFKGDNSTYFGYTTDFLETRDSSKKISILVGAPKSQDKFHPEINQPGALFKCDPNRITDTCEQVEIQKGGNIKDTDYEKSYEIYHGKDDGWLGASLSIGDAVAVCAPRWRNNIEITSTSNPVSWMNGICYEIPRILDSAYVAKFAFLSKDHNKQTLNETQYYYHYMHGLMGMSVQHLVNDDEKLIIGAPGLRDASGGLIEFQPVNIASEPYDPDRNNDYFGYAVTSGKFLGDDTVYVALGGPRGNSTGQVKIVRATGSQFTVKAVLNGQEPGSYFGSVLCRVQTNQSKDILVVGAPFYGNLTDINIDVNHINQDEGIVYVYSFDNALGMLQQIQQLRGSSSPKARFGSAITSPGDINRDGAMDLAVGAPFEDEGRGVVYIFNGYKGKFWERPTQMIKARSINNNLREFGMYLSQYNMDIDTNLYNDLVVGAPGSDRVVMLKSNPTISMEVSLRTSLKDNIIQDTDKKFAVQVCFLYIGDQSLPDDVTVNYTVVIDPDMTRQGFQERVLADDRSNIFVGEKKIFRSLTNAQCSQNYTVNVQPYKRDIVTPVTFIVRYAIKHAAGTGLNCSVQPCPVISVFDAKRPVPDADFFEEMIEFFREGCGEDNKCETDLTLQVIPEFKYGATDVLIRGPDAGFMLHVTVSNKKEASYNTKLIIDAPDYISYQKVVATTPYPVTCSPHNVEDDTRSTLECQLSYLEKPFVTGRTDRFVVYFGASRTGVVPSFPVDLSLETRSEDVDISNNKKMFTIPVESRAEIDFTGVGSPELYVTSKTKADSVMHRFDFINNGPTILDRESTFSLAYPTGVMDDKPLLKVLEMNFIVPVNTIYFDCGADINLKLVTVGTDSSGINSTRTYKLTEKNPTVDNNLNLNCERDVCKKIRCTINPLGVKDFVRIKINYSMDPDILAKVKAENSLSLLSVAVASMPDDLGLTSSLSHSATAKTDVVPAEQKEEKVAWWIVLLGIIGGLAIIAAVAGICWKFGFFKRKHREELDKRKQYQETEPNNDKETLIEKEKEKEAENLNEKTENKAENNIPNNSTS